MRARGAAVAIAAALAAGLPTVASAGLGNGHSGWRWGLPHPQGRPLHAIGFAGRTGYAAGDFGTVLRTTDGGASWSSVYAPTRDYLDLIQVMSPRSFVVGGGCTLLRSDDAGRTFRRLRYARCGHDWLRALAFPTVDVGFLIRPGRQVLRTTNGRRFAPVGTPPQFASEDAFFTGPSTGVVVGTGYQDDLTGSVERTTDGGLHWDSVAKTPEELNAVTFPSREVGYVAGDAGVMATHDGGLSWQPAPAPGTSSGVLDYIACGDELHCVVGTPSSGLAYTDDGFATTHGTVLGPFAINRVAYSSPSRITAVGDGGEVWRSDNAGAAFSRVGKEPQGGLGGDVDRSSRRLAFVPSGPGILRTTDGGETWTRVRVPTVGYDFVSEAWFASPRLGYAHDQHWLYATHDGGRTWERRSKHNAGTTDVWAGRDGTVVLAGWDPLARSTDGGRHFAPIDSPALRGRVYQSVDQTAGGHVFAFGRDGIVQSRDGGRHWTAMPPPRGSLPIVSARVVGRETAWALTHDGRLWRTSDGGRHWREVTSTGATLAGVLAFDDARHGWVATAEFGREEATWMLRTDDGGRSWRPQALDSAEWGGAVALGRRGGISLTGGRNALFTRTAGDVPPPRVRIALRAGRRSLPRRGVVTVAGQLTPRRSRARVVVSARYAPRRPGGEPFVRQHVVRTGGRGAFTTRFFLDRSAWLVAQWSGDRRSAGAGSSAVRVAVR